MTHNTFMNCKDWSKSDLELEKGSLPLPSDVHANSYPLPGVCGISKRFYRKRKAFDFLNKMRYIFRWLCCWRNVTSTTMVATSAAILDFTKN